jgi:regulatory protein
MKADSVAHAAELRERALRLLSRREHSRFELERKLSERNGSVTTSLGAVLDQLEQEGLLADARFVEAYVAERLDKGFGPLRVRAELQTKGISETLIDEYLRLDDETCFELLCRADRKWASTNPNIPHKPFDDAAETAAADRHEIAKRARFLESRGFPTHLIARLLRQDESFPS